MSTRVKMLVNVVGAPGTQYLPGQFYTVADGLAAAWIAAGQAVAASSSTLRDGVPELAITQYKGAVADEAAMIALAAQEGDWCVRQDVNKAYMLTNDTPGTAGNWIVIGDVSDAPALIPTGAIAVTQNASRYRLFNGIAASATEADHQLLVPVAGKITKLVAKMSAALTAGATATVTVRKNGSATALTLSFTDADTTTLKTDSDEVAVAAGDLLSVAVACDDNAPGSVNAHAAFLFIAD